MSAKSPGPDPGNDLEMLASLAEPLRNLLYQQVMSSAEPVGRDEAAEALGISRQVAAYHLDRLAEDGLLTVEFRRLTGRAGPGAGRPAKLYRRSERDYEVSVPPRRYGLAARILLEAVNRGHLEASLLSDIARQTGRDLGRSGVETALRETGYEPVEEAGEIRFRNCPFHMLREQDRDTTCAMNLALVEGVLEETDSEVRATLDPEDGYCCVRLI